MRQTLFLPALLPLLFLLLATLLPHTAAQFQFFEQMFQGHPQQQQQQQPPQN
ncbi:hypothetical protein MMC11_008907, partial [Xylographa trunciseda]|nr:hypothetical protein [Xylographa trunciseda]